MPEPTELSILHIFQTSFITTVQIQHKVNFLYRAMYSPIYIITHIHNLQSRWDRRGGGTDCPEPRILEDLEAKPVPSITARPHSIIILSVVSVSSIEHNINSLLSAITKKLIHPPRGHMANQHDASPASFPPTFTVAKSCSLLKLRKLKTASDGGTMKGWLLMSLRPTSSVTNTTTVMPEGEKNWGCQQ